MDRYPIDSLYCEEQSWEEDEVVVEEVSYGVEGLRSADTMAMSDEAMHWEDEELLSLSAKEKEANPCNYLSDQLLASSRSAAVDWMMKVVASYSFSAAAAVLAVNYLDRFLASLHFNREKPWMAQLSAVACLSLAAKVEETHVPLLLDLQVEETRYVFEAKTIQRMELLVLSTLHWRMHPVTPLSFIEHIVRRLGLKSRLHWDFFKRCERLLVSLIADSQLVGHLPSIVAAATMLHVINELEPWNLLEYEDQLLSVLRISKDRVDGCLRLINELASSAGHKRKHLYSVTTSSSSEPAFKKIHYASMNKAFVVDVLGSHEFGECSFFIFYC